MAPRRGLLLAIVVLALTAGTTFATHTSSGLTTLATWRGTMDRHHLAAFAGQLGAMHRLGRSDLFVVRAALAPGGTTEWHGHTGPSIVTVTAGSIEVIEATGGGRCSSTTYDAGQAFFHTEHAHTFVNRATAPAEFLVAYFVPQGSPVTHPPTPSC